MRDDHRSSKDRIRLSEIEIIGKASKTAVDMMKDHLDQLPTKEEVIGLRNYMRTNIDSFRESNEQFSREFNAHLAIIRRYDEVLSDKASKHSLYSTETKLIELYNP